MTEPTFTEAVQGAADQPAPQTINEARIRIRAYELYEKRSGAPGDALSDWYQAEAELEREAAAPAPQT